MVRAALTGGLATGKSYALRRFQALGAATVDADVLVHEALRPGSDAALAIRDRFGPDVLTCSGAVDRKALAGIVFHDIGARRDLEAILHPEVYRAIERWFDAFAAQGRPLAIADIPLLYETRHADRFDCVIATVCAPDEQMRRALARGLSEEEARLRIAAQMPTAEKAARADYVIHTDGAYEDTDRQVETIYRELLAKTEGPGPTA
jgi:dephospho-CoA kinase